MSYGSLPAPPAGPDVLAPDMLQVDQAQLEGPFYSVSLASGALTARHALPAYQADQPRLQPIR